MRRNEIGITIIALVVTIIVLLILAGITINMILGENGLIERTRNAISKYSEAEYNEMLVLNQIEKDIINKANIDSEERKSISELKEGDEVIYTDKNGNPITCIVLYDKTSDFGIQVISKDIVGEKVEIGNGTGIASWSTDSERYSIAKTSYNTAIATLNNKAQSYMNNELSPENGARCVGSSPNEAPITSEEDTGTYMNSYGYFINPINYNNKYKSADSSVSNNSGDYSQMKKLNCHNVSEWYWLASRNVESDESSTFFYVRLVNNLGNFHTSFIGLFRVYSDGSTRSLSNMNYIRPVFILKPTIHFIEEDGNKILIE